MKINFNSIIFTSFTFLHCFIDFEYLSVISGGFLTFWKILKSKMAAVPVIIGAFGLVKKGTENYIGKIPGNIRITELQKTVLLEPLTYLGWALSIT